MEVAQHPLDTPKGPTFSLDITSPGAASLRQTVKAKLSDVMGSYTDDVLAEYVVVLVGHGKHQAQATKDLEAFLGDQSEAFVSWLWEHLSSNIHLYTSVPNLSKTGSCNDHAVKNGEVLGKDNNVDSQSVLKSRAQVSSITHEGERTARIRKGSSKDVDTRTRKELDVTASSSVRVKTESRSVNHEPEHRISKLTRPSTKHPRSPDTWTQKERSHTDERDRHKRHASPPRVNASRRLLAAAVREAVAPAGGHLKRSESSLKRLRSVVSADVESTEATEEGYEQPPKVKARTDASKQLKRSIPAMVVAMKAAAAAAEDVNKVRGRYIGSVWDRLGKNSDRGVDDDEVEADEPMIDRDAREEIESRFVDTRNQENDRINDGKWSRLRSVSDRLTKVSTEHDVAVFSDPLVDGIIEAQSVAGRNVHSASFKGGKQQAVETDDSDFRRSTTYNDGRRVRSEQGHEESVTVQYRLAQNMEKNGKEIRKQKVSNATSGLANPSQKIVSISVNVNTWKPPKYDSLKETIDMEQQMMVSAKQLQDHADKNMDDELMRNDDEKDLESESDGEQNVSDMKKRMRQVQLEMTKLRAKQAEVTKEPQKTSTFAVSVAEVKPIQPCQDDADLRTVFVTNIHFAATKESVTAHFNRCGEVVRVIMLTDAATGQPKGSAYVEFCSKDAAEKALTLNESSFLSRLLKVVRKDTAVLEAPTVVVRPPLRRPIPLALRVPIRSRFMRGSPYLLRRVSSLPRSYGNAPNLQWKRDSAAPAGMGSGINSPFMYGSRPAYGPMRSNRSFSYVRTASNLSPQIPATGQDQKDVTGHELQDGSEMEVEGTAQVQKHYDGKEQKSG